METFELILILLACVIISSPLDQVVKKISLPIVQIIIGFIVAIILPEVADVHVDPELFLVLFIAPLLFNEARESTKPDLWSNKASILSLAIGLVLLTVLVVGFALNLMVPSIPLAAAFACAGALGPTDAAAVGALGSTITLTRRQKTLLSGEALINDASGVVSFQFALAAALTGAFSAADAGASFAILFFGGILAGLVMGAAAFFSVFLLRRYGFENTVVHVLYEVFTPFVVFLAAEALGVSGILAVVAAGLIMANTAPRLASSYDARLHLLSNGFWEILVFLINGVLFVLLGMQLPQAMSPTLHSQFNLFQLIGIIAVMTALVIGVRFCWVSILELFHKDFMTGERGIQHVGTTLKDALVTTIAGPKGAVTLSIIFTIPLTMTNGEPFPERDLIIFLTAGVILFTLLIADLTLPHLAGGGDSVDEESILRTATISVLDRTVRELQSTMRGDPNSELVPALRLVTARYRSRLFRERFELEGYGEIMRTLLFEVAQRQQQRADEIQGSADLSARERAPYYTVLRGIRRSVGYYGRTVNVGSRFNSIHGNLALAWQRLFPRQLDAEHAERIYYDTCLFAIDLERTAIDYLESYVSDHEGTEAEVAQILANEHQSAMESIWARIDYGQEFEQDRDAILEHGAHTTMPEGMMARFSEQFKAARRHAEEADELALNLELEQIRRLQNSGEISEQQAHELRESVYVMQMSLAD